MVTILYNLFNNSFALCPVESQGITSTVMQGVKSILLKLIEKSLYESNWKHSS